MLDLRGDVFLGRTGADQFGEHFGAAEDHAQRILQVVRDRAENFVLEAVGALQPQPLRREPAVGLHQRAGALGDAVLELGIGLVQLPVKDDVVERDREPAREDLHQRTVGVGERSLGLQQYHDFAPAAGAQIKHAAVVGEFVLAAQEGGFHHLPQIRIERFRAGSADETAVAAGARQHREIAVGIAVVAQHQDAGAIDVEQRGELRQHALGEALHRLEVVQSGGGVDDDFQPAPGLHHALELLVAAQRRGQRGEQLVGRQFGLGLVVVDVVLDDDAALRRLAGLAGAQDDADGLVLEFAADVFDEFEAGDVGLHDDVEQHGRDVGVVAHQRAAFGRGIGREDFQRGALQVVVAQRKAGAFMHRGVVVDDGDLPFADGRILRNNSGIVDQVEDIVLFGH